MLHPVRVPPASGSLPPYLGSVLDLLKKNIDPGGLMRHLGQALDLEIDGTRFALQSSVHGEATEIRVSGRGLPRDGAWRRRQADFCGEG